MTRLLSNNYELIMSDDFKIILELWDFPDLVCSNLSVDRLNNLRSLVVLNIVKENFPEILL